MSDITDSVFQQQVADSLLEDSNIIAVLPHQGNLHPQDTGSDAERGDTVFDNPDDYFSDVLYDQQHNAAVLGDEGLRQKLVKEGRQVEEQAEEISEEERLTSSPEERGVQRLEQLEAQRAQAGGEQANQPQEQEQTEQAQAPAAESVQQGIAALEATVEQHQLDDPQTAKTFSEEFCSALGTDIYRAGIDVQALGSTVAKTALSALQVYEAAQGNIESLPPITGESARAFSYDLLKGLGIDPRTVDVDQQLLSQTVLGGVLNFYDTFQKYGGSVTDLAKLNDPQAAEMFLGNFMRALGSDQPVSRQTAIKVADALGNYLLGFIGKINTANQRQEEARQGQGSRSNSGRGRGQRVPKRFQEGVKGARAPRFQTNSGPGEPFSADV